MAEISFGGLATGLPTEDIVESLMAIERRPLDRLEAEKEYETLRLQAYGEFNDLLNDLRSTVSGMNLTSDVRTTAVRLAAEDVISASSNGAATGSYDIAVAQLAQVQKTVADGLSSDEDALLGSGTFTINGADITIDSSNNSLAGLRDAINAISDETGVTASIINDGSDGNAYHLVMTGKDASTSFSVSHDLVDGEGSPLFATTDVRTAQQAIAYVDGIEVVSNSNTLSGVIPGLTINLNSESEIITPASGETPAVYETTTLNVEADSSGLKEKISEFVSSYNAIMEWIKAGYEEAEETTTDDEDSDDEDSDSETSTSLSQILRGDATINDIKRSLQGILSDAVDSSGSLQILSEVGIATQMDGTLVLNESTLDKALDTNFDDVVKLLSGEGEEQGVMKKFNAYLVKTTSYSDGMYAAKRDRYESAVDRLDNQILDKEAMMEKIEARIYAQFTAMEALVSTLNSQSSYLTQAFASLSGGNS